MTDNVLLTLCLQCTLTACNGREKAREPMLQPSCPSIASQKDAISVDECCDLYTHRERERSVVGSHRCQLQINSACLQDNWGHVKCNHYYAKTLFSNSFEIMITRLDQG